MRTNKEILLAKSKTKIQNIKDFISKWEELYAVVALT